MYPQINRYVRVSLNELGNEILNFSPFLFIKNVHMIRTNNYSMHTLTFHEKYSYTSQHHSKKVGP